MDDRRRPWLFSDHDRFRPLPWNAHSAAALISIDAMASPISRASAVSRSSTHRVAGNQILDASGPILDPGRRSGRPPVAGDTADPARPGFGCAAGAQASPFHSLMPSLMGALVKSAAVALGRAAIQGSACKGFRGAAPRTFERNRCWPPASMGATAMRRRVPAVGQAMRHSSSWTMYQFGPGSSVSIPQSAHGALRLVPLIFHPPPVVQFCR